MGAISEPAWTAMIFYVLLGALIGLVAVMITRAVYGIEDLFEELPIHWMWWPAVGAVAVGIIGYMNPHTLGVGYDNIDNILTGRVIGMALLVLIILKFVSWSIYLGSGTSGGTLAPLFTLGGGLGVLVGSAVNSVAPSLGISVPVAGLVGMAAIFAGASHALLASIVFAFEATRQPLGLLPLLAGCSTAYLISVTMQRTSIMTERLSRRGVVIRPEYGMDFMAQHVVRDSMTTEVVTVNGDQSVVEARKWLSARTAPSQHQGFPVVNEQGAIIGVITRRDLLDAGEETKILRDLIKRPPVVVYPESTLREAADHMVRSKVGRLVVVSRETGAMVGIVSRSDLLDIHEKRLA
jgi:CBS domain-containing protein